MDKAYNNKDIMLSRSLVSSFRGGDHCGELQNIKTDVPVKRTPPAAAGTMPVSATESETPCIDISSLDLTEHHHLENKSIDNQSAIVTALPQRPNFFAFPEKGPSRDPHPAFTPSSMSAIPMQRSGSFFEHHLCKDMSIGALIKNSAPRYRQRSLSRRSAMNTSSLSSSSSFPRSASLPANFEADFTYIEPQRALSTTFSSTRKLCKDMNIEVLVSQPRYKRRSLERRSAMNTSFTSSDSLPIHLESDTTCVKSQGKHAPTIVNDHYVRHNTMSERRKGGADEFVNSPRHNSTWDVIPPPENENKCARQTSRLFRRVSQSTESLTKHLKVLVCRNASSSDDVEKYDNILQAHMAQIEAKNIWNSVRQSD